MRRKEDFELIGGKLRRCLANGLGLVEGIGVCRENVGPRGRLGRVVGSDCANGEDYSKARNIDCDPFFAESLCCRPAAPTSCGQQFLLQHRSVGSEAIDVGFAGGKIECDDFLRSKIVEPHDEGPERVPMR